MIRWLALFGLLFAAPACADCPSLSHLTIEGQTITLTARTPPAALDRDNPAALHLHFAQMHLGFPLPPFLSISLEPNGPDGDWTITTLRLERASPAAPMVFAPDSLRLSGSPADTVFTIEGDAMVPGAVLIPIHIETHLSSP